MKAGQICLVVFLFLKVPPAAPGKGTSPQLPAIAPPKQPTLRRVPLTRGLTAPMLAQAAHLDVQADRTGGTLTRFWRGVAILEKGADALNWASLLPLLKAQGATLMRVAPFSTPGLITMAPDGTPVVRWDSVDARLQSLAGAGCDVLLDIAPVPGLTEQAWSAVIASMVKRYGSDPKFGVARWELMASWVETKVWYAPFARAVRAQLPNGSAGVLFTSGDGPGNVSALLTACARNHLPLDSIGWTLAETPTDAVRTVQRIAAALAEPSAPKGVVLLPQLAPALEPNAAFAVAARLALLSADGLRALVGILASVNGDDIRPASVWKALALLPQTAGTELFATGDADALHCLPMRAGERLSLLVWRDPDEAAPDRLLLLRLRHLPPNLQAGARLQVFAVSETNAARDRAKASLAPSLVAQCDTPGDTDLEIPLLLPPGQALRIDALPQPSPPPFVLSLSADRWNGLPFDPLELTVTVRNASARPQTLALALTGSVSEMVPASLSLQKAGVLQPNEARRFVYPLHFPLSARSPLAFLNARAGGQSVAALCVRVESPLIARLLTPRVELDLSGKAGAARLLLTNRGRLPLDVTLTTQGGAAGKKVTLAPGKPSQTVAVPMEAPERQSGLYPVTVQTRSGDGQTTRHTVYVGVPALGHFAVMPISLDGDLSEWADADAIGLARVEQTGGKAWGGLSDLSARAYVKWDAKFLYFACEVNDDVTVPPNALSTIEKGDSVQFGLRGEPKGANAPAPYCEFAVARLKSGQIVVARLDGGHGSRVVPQVNAAVKRYGIRTVYEAAIPWTQLPGFVPRSNATFGLWVRVNDNDGDQSGSMVWGRSDSDSPRPALLAPLRLVK